MRERALEGRFEKRVGEVRQLGEHRLGGGDVAGRGPEIAQRQPRELVVFEVAEPRGRVVLVAQRRREALAERVGAARRIERVGDEPCEPVGMAHEMRREERRGAAQRDGDAHRRLGVGRPDRVQLGRARGEHVGDERRGARGIGRGRRQPLDESRQTGQAGGALEISEIGGHWLGSRDPRRAGRVVPRASLAAPGAARGLPCHPSHALARSPRAIADTWISSVPP